MARRTQDVEIIDADSRDYGKVYRVTEMSSAASEDWAMRLIMAAMGSGLDLGDTFDAQNMSLEAVARIGLSAFGKIPTPVMRSLMDEMKKQFTIKPEPVTQPEFVRPLNAPEDVEDVATWMKLRGEFMKMHLGFLKTVFASSLGAGTISSAKAVDAQ